MPEGTADRSGQQEGLDDVAEHGLHLLRQGGRGTEAAEQAASA
ncbi:hypothetical protein [Streptomyces sp. NPDC001970]